MGVYLIYLFPMVFMSSSKFLLEKGDQEYPKGWDDGTSGGNNLSS